MQTSERSTIQEPPKLLAAFGLGQTEVQIKQMHTSRLATAIEPNPAAAMQGTSLFSPTDLQIDVFLAGEREATQDRVAVATSPTHRNVAVMHAMSQPECLPYQIRLNVSSRALGLVVDFLKEHDVGLVMAEDLDHPFGPIPAIESADTLMNVVRDDSQTHTFARTRREHKTECTLDQLQTRACNTRAPRPRRPRHAQFGDRRPAFGPQVALVMRVGLGAALDRGVWLFANCPRC